MTDTNTPDLPGHIDRSALDDLEAKEDQRETDQVDASLEDEGLLPVPEATPADGPAPGA